MEMIERIIKEIKSYPGLTRKKRIGIAANILQSVSDFGKTAAYLGEDAAALQYRDEYLLLAADGIWPGLIEANPYAAGKASVMVSVNDIYAMGGRPLAMVNVTGISDEKYYEEIMAGIRNGCRKFRVPMVGGHIHPDTKEVSLSIAILGTARKLLMSNNAVAGQNIILAVDLQGRGYQCRPVISWDTNSGKTPEQVLDRLEVIPQIAEAGLCQTAKDVSNGGTLGTVALLLETSKKGAVINIDAIPKPDTFPIIDWLKAFLSYGFIFCVDRDKTKEVIKKFKQKYITAQIIGEVIEEEKVEILFQGKRDILFDFTKEHIVAVA